MFALVLLISLPLILAAAGAGWFLGRPTAASTDSAATALGAQPTPTPTTLVSPAPTTSPRSSIFVLPPTAAGLLLTPGQQADQLLQGLPADIAAKSTVGLYSSPADPGRILLLLGIDEPNPAPATTLDLLLDEVGSSTADLKLSAPKEYAAGSMGGYMKCATGQEAAAGGTVALDLCGVSDAHGVIVTMFTGRSVADAATATRTLRPTFEHI